MSLNNWSFTDVLDDNNPWTFPDITIDADEYLEGNFLEYQDKMTVLLNYQLNQSEK